ncbi:MAG TPA: hypothetical protein VFE08_12420 [Candidatus Sulfotelmatobacter sp.]|jgi:hypothetical protein|nr:hypothetical protein [Candidatus Sulfotelmatobacter sp.]
MLQPSHAQTSQPPIIQISIIHQSTILADADVAPVVAALQKQVTNDFRPVWGVDAELAVIPKGTPPPAGTWWLVLLDDSDQANALGYHDLTTEGLPIGKVFAGSDLKAGTSWTVTASHELLEMLGDPNINLTVFVQSSGTAGILYAYEVCDACEDDSLAYQIDNVLLSDFVYPSWFESFRTEGSTQFDRMNKINMPFQLLVNGYIGTFNVSAGSGWQQQTAEKQLTNVLYRGAVGTRRERRTVPRDQWVNSLPQRKLVSNAQTYLQQLQTIQRLREAA